MQGASIYEILQTIMIRRHFGSHTHLVVGLACGAQAIGFVVDDEKAVFNLADQINKALHVAVQASRGPSRAIGEIKGTAVAVSVKHPFQLNNRGPRQG